MLCYSVGTGRGDPLSERLRFKVRQHHRKETGVLLEGDKEKRKRRGREERVSERKREKDMQA